MTPIETLLALFYSLLCGVVGYALARLAAFIFNIIINYKK